MTDDTRIDYVWTDGAREHEFCGDNALDRARSIRTLYGQGKVWRRVFRNDFLEEITDVTEPRKE